MTLNVHQFSIYNNTFITQWFLTDTDSPFISSHLLHNDTERTLILHLNNHIYNTMNNNMRRFSIYTITFITQWPLTHTIHHLYHHIYNTMTLNVHRFSIYTITFITQWPLTYAILHLYNHICNTMTLNVHDSPFIPSHL